MKIQKKATKKLTKEAFIEHENYFTKPYFEIFSIMTTDLYFIHFFILTGS